MNKPIFIHVGFPKTGTTWLQKYFFPCHSEIGYIGKPTPQPNDPRLFDLKSSIVKVSKEEFEPDKIRDELQVLIDEINNKEIKVYGISLETLIPFPMVGEMSPLTIAERLKKVFEKDNVKIIIGIRNQLSMIASFYSEVIKGGHILSMEQLFFSPRSNAHEKLFPFFKFNNLIDYYAKLFGKDNVHIYLKEYLKEKQCFIDEITSYLQISNFVTPKTTKRVNPKLSKLGLFVLRSLINPIFYTRFTHISPLNPLSILSKPLIYILDKIDTKNKILKRKVEYDYPGVYKYHLESAIHKKIHTYCFRAIRFIDRYSFSRLSLFKFRINKHLKDFIKDYYASANKELENNYNLPLARYGYPL